MLYYMGWLTGVIVGVSGTVSYVTEQPWFIIGIVVTLFYAGLVEVEIR